MVHSAGLAIIYKNKILLVHPTNSKWTGSFSIPKGHLNKGESAIEAAIRETLEETGILVDRSLVKNPEIEIIYYDKKGKPRKKVSCFMVNIDSLSDINLTTEVLPKAQLQLDEIDWAGFVPFEKAKLLIYPPLLKLIN